MAKATERRQCARARIDAKVAFRRPRETHYLIPIKDLSPHGCRISSPGKLKMGDLVWVQLPSLEALLAWVRWSQAAQSGVEFERPMHRAVFEMMAGRLAAAA